MAMVEFGVSQPCESAIVMRVGGEEPDRELRLFCTAASGIRKENRHLLNYPEALLPEPGQARPKDLCVVQLHDATFTLLETEGLGDFAWQDVGPVLDLVSSLEWLAEQRDAGPDAELFAEYRALVEVMPFGQSELNSDSLVSVAIKNYEQAAPGAELADITPALGHGHASGVPADNGSLVADGGGHP